MTEIRRYQGRIKVNHRSVPGVQSEVSLQVRRWGDVAACSRPLDELVSTHQKRE